MTLDDAIKQLRPLEPELRAGGLGALYVFGSTARGAQSAGSDLDLAYDPGERRGFNILHVEKLKLLIAQRLDVPVDLVCRETITRRVDRITRDLKRVF